MPNRLPTGGPPYGFVKAIVAAVVTTAMFADPSLDPLSVTEVGVTVQVACAGAPLQLS